jgi:hypothetical protein
MTGLVDDNTKQGTASLGIDQSTLSDGYHTS